MDKYICTNKCLSCQSENIQAVFNIPNLPIADQLNTSPDEKTMEVPLTLLKCNQCSLVFIKELILPELLFPQNYPYFTGVSKALVRHFNELADHIYSNSELNQNSLIIDIGSNDGTALDFFQKKGIPVLGIDPTTRPSLKAIIRGIPTLRAFWNYETAKIISDEISRKADVIFCNNVISHVNNPAEFIESLNEICKPSTKIISEFPYIKSIIKNNGFDIIFHQHVSYFSIRSFEYLITQFGFFLNDAEILNVHGGNLRCYFSKENSQSPRLKNLIADEEDFKTNDTKKLKSFFLNVSSIKNDTLRLLNDLNNKGFKIMGYGAAGKATTFLKYFEIDQTQIQGIIDKNPFKQNKYFPAYNHPIYNPDILTHTTNLKPDYLLILAWTLKEEIISELSDFRSRGGKFIVVLPNLQLI